MTILRAAVATVATAALLLAGSLPAAACTPDPVSVSEVVAGSDAIVVAEIESQQHVRGGPGNYGFHVRRVLKGSADDHIVVRGMDTSICGDSLGYNKLGWTVILALGFTYPNGQPTHPVWVYRPDGTLKGSTFGGEAREADQIETLAAGIAYIRDALGALPETATTSPVRPAGTPSGLLVAVGLVSALGASGLWGRRLTAARSSGGIR